MDKYVLASLFAVVIPFLGLSLHSRLEGNLTTRRMLFFWFFLIITYILLVLFRNALPNLFKESESWSKDIYFIGWGVINLICYCIIRFTNIFK